MGMINKNSKAKEDVDYWRSMVDVVLGILLVVLLAMSLLMLGLMDQPLLEEGGDYYDAEPSPTATDWDGGGWGSPTPSLTPTPTFTPTPTPHWDDDGGGGGGYGDGHWYSPSPSPTASPEPDLYEGQKSAVQVRIRDEETNQVLPISGIGFAVFDEAEQQMAYNVYYPEKMEYKRFETTKRGFFFLPEKLLPGTYTLQNLNAPQDYDLAPDVEFEVVKGNDWDEPIIVDAFLAPCKNTITLEMRDAETGDPVPGGVYSVVAALDVITSDGTLRYQAGDVIGTISCDETGTAVTGPMYLGTFSLVQTEIPFGYAKADMGRPVLIEKKPAEYTVTRTMEKTRVVITVRDELTLARVAEIPFVLTSKGFQTVDIVADGNGEIHLASLEKNTDYSFTMKSAVSGYRYSDAIHTFRVDNDGLIEGTALYEMTVDARKIRCTFGAASAIFSNPIIGHDMGLFDTNGAVIEQWYSKEEPTAVDGLEPGDYILTIDGQETRVKVRDTAQKQVFNVRVWQSEDIAMAAGIGVAVIGALTAAVIIFLKKRKKNAGSGKEPKEEPKKKTRKEKPGK